MLLLSMRLMFYDSGKFNLKGFFIFFYPFIMSIFFIYNVKSSYKFQNTVL